MSVSAPAFMRQEPTWRHVPAEEYSAFVQSRTGIYWKKQVIWRRNVFVRQYPDLRDWARASLLERVGKRYGESQPSYPASYLARRYLMYLALRAALRFEWDWLIAVHTLFMWDLLDHLGMTTALTALIDDAQRLGYQRAAADHAIRWAVTRIFLHTLDFRVESLAQTHLLMFVWVGKRMVRWRHEQRQSPARLARVGRGAAATRLGAQATGLETDGHRRRAGGDA